MLRIIMVVTTLLVLLFNQFVSAQQVVVETKELFKAEKSLTMKLKAAGKGKVERVANRWKITGDAPLRVEFVPTDDTKWDISAFRLAGVSLVNRDNGITTIDGRLTNEKATNWGNVALGFAVAPTGEKVTLGFPFNMAEDRYQGPEIFKDQLAKPNGHRLHWRSFDPNVVTGFTIYIKSSTGKVNMLLDDLFLAWPANSDLNQKMEKMPYLDTLGQVKAVSWPGKLNNIDEIKTVLIAELATAEKQAKESKFSRFGGWKDGPKNKATGHFRTENINGKWWLIDPEGHFFFSVGVCSAGNKSETIVNRKRIEAGFFEFLPDSKDDLHLVGHGKHNNVNTINFAAINYARSLGVDWQTKYRHGVHTRLRAWGMNTLGAWSDETLQRDGRTPYTLIASPGWLPSSKPLPAEPFKEGFEDDVVKTLQKFDWAKDDPFCLGIFIGNELAWPDQFTPAVLQLEETDPTKQWVLSMLQKKYSTLEELNASWKSAFTDWKQVLAGKLDTLPKAASTDIEPLYLDFTTAYFSKCKAGIKKALPNKLYLGCRTHRGPAVIGQAAVGHVDVFSVNCYEYNARPSQIPATVDMPVIIGEFHFCAVDRGIPSPGLQGSWDQRQRGLTYCNYLASALADPRIVGVHWFQWTDHSAAGRYDRENHQCGLIDVTGRSHPEFVELVTNATKFMYPARKKEKQSTEQILDMLVK
jgi:hypothetical protein